MSISGNGVISGNGILRATRSYTLTVENDDHSSTVPTAGNHTYTEGSTVGVECTPDEGYVFDHWELDEANAGSTNPTSIGMDANHALTSYTTLQTIFGVTVYVPIEYSRFIVIDDIVYGDAEQTIQLEVGEYTLSTYGGGNFDYWETSGDVSVADQNESTTLIVSGSGSLTLHLA